MQLSDLHTGERAVIAKVSGHGSFRKRLIEMGFIRGKAVRVVLNAPLKDPIEYEILGYKVSLRREEASKIEVISEEEAKLHIQKEHAGESLPAILDREIVELAEERGHSIRVALVGNPNCGKTSLFNIASGSHEHVGNYSGVTVDAKEGHFDYKGYNITLVDLPGTYSLSAYSPEELYVRKNLLEHTPDVVLNVVDASNIERNLYLTAQLIDMNLRVAMALNMYDELQAKGDSIDSKQLGHLHIHTKAPSVIIELAQRYGEFLTFKLENMQIQHNERDRIVKPAVHKPLSVVAVVNGAGMRKLFEGLGADCVIDADATMNTSAQEFVSAFDSLDADEIVVLPNNKNIILAAEQAASLVPEKHVTVLPSRSFAEGYYAIAMDIPDEKDLEKRIRGMRSGIDNIVTLRETTASRDYSYHEIRCRRGEDIAFLGGELVCVERDWKAAILGALAMIEDIDDRETGIVLRGAGVSVSDEEALSEAIAGQYPMLELEFVDAGQEIYHWEIGIM